MKPSRTAKKKATKPQLSKQEIVSKHADAPTDQDGESSGPVTLINYFGEQFQEKNNPLLLIDAFLLAMQTKRYPPIGVLRRIEKAFRQFRADSAPSLDRAFGFKEIGRGTHHKSLLEETRDRIMLQHVWRLKELFDLSLTTACEWVAARYASNNDPHFFIPDMGIFGLSAGSLNEKWKEWTTSGKIKSMAPALRKDAKRNHLLKTLDNVQARAAYRKNLRFPRPTGKKN